MEKAALVKKAMAAHRASVGDAGVSDSDAAANHVQREMDRLG